MCTWPWWGILGFYRGPKNLVFEKLRLTSYTKCIILNMGSIRGNIFIFGFGRSSSFPTLIIVIM